jgi:hypothetical protein
MSSAVQQLKHLMTLPREARRILVAQYLKPLFPTNKSLRAEQETSCLEWNSYCCVSIANINGMGHPLRIVHMHHQPTSKVTTKPKESTLKQARPSSNPSSGVREDANLLTLKLTHQSLLPD